MSQPEKSPLLSDQSYREQSDIAMALELVRYRDALRRIVEQTDQQPDRLTLQDIRETAQMALHG